MSKLYCLLIVFSMFISGCATKVPVLSKKHERQIKLSEMGSKSFINGDLKEALNFYNMALKVSRSMEDFDSIAANLLNIATIYHILGNVENAEVCVDELLNESMPAYNSVSLSEAAFIKARLYMEKKKYDLATEWVDKAYSLCNDMDCPFEGRMYNLKAKLFYERGEVKSAIRYSEKGRKLNIHYKNNIELANSLRIIADSLAALGKHEEAFKLYEETLFIDKKTGVSKKIALDLILMGDLSLKEGSEEKALFYYKRAISVSKNANDKKGVENANDKIDRYFK